MKVFTILLLCCVSLVAVAEPVTQIVYSAQAGECSLSLEASPQWQALRLRVQHPRYASCPIAPRDVEAMLAPALAKLALVDTEVIYASLSLGRLVDYPWLSAYLAETAAADRNWNSKKGRPVRGDVNAYTALILSTDTVLRQFQNAFDAYGYTISGASVEKVLVGGSENIPYYQGKALPGRLPFDAQVWLHLHRQ